MDIHCGSLDNHARHVIEHKDLAFRPDPEEVYNCVGTGTHDGYVIATLPDLEGDELVRIGDGIYRYAGVKNINTNPTLQFVRVRAADWTDEECFRVSGEIGCPICGQKYWRHPRVAKEAPSLVRGCDGRLLKL